MGVSGTRPGSPRSTWKRDCSSPISGSRATSRTAICSATLETVGCGWPATLQVVVLRVICTSPSFSHPRSLPSSSKMRSWRRRHGTTVILAEWVIGARLGILLAPHGCHLRDFSCEPLFSGSLCGVWASTEEYMIVGLFWELTSGYCFPVRCLVRQRIHVLMSGYGSSCLSHLFVYFVCFPLVDPRSQEHAEAVIQAISVGRTKLGKGEQVPFQVWESFCRLLGTDVEQRCGAMEQQEFAVAFAIYQRSERDFLRAFRVPNLAPTPIVSGLAAISQYPVLLTLLVHSVKIEYHIEAPKEMAPSSNRICSRTRSCSRPSFKRICRRQPKTELKNRCQRHARLGFGRRLGHCGSYEFATRHACSDPVFGDAQCWRYCC